MPAPANLPKAYPGLPKAYPAFPKAPPKPAAKPWVSVPDLAQYGDIAVPSEPIGAWRALWHAIGSNLPAHVNASRASRAAMRKFAKTHG